MRKISFVLAAVFISSQLFAQDTLKNDLPSLSSIAEKTMDPVIMTANKFQNKTSFTGKVVVVIPRWQLERASGKDLSQILTEQTGLYIGGANSNLGKDKSVYLRGAGIQYTLITIDGVPVYDPSGIAGIFDIRNIPVANIERIEILKGSQSTLYGSDAIAGVINIITRKSSNKTVTGNLGASYGSNSTFRGNGGINGNTGKFEYNAGFSILSTDGINEAINNGNFTTTDRDKFEQQGVQLGFAVKPTSNFRTAPFLRYNHAAGDLDQGAFTDELDYTFDEKSWQAGIRNEINLKKTKLNVIYSYNSIQRLYIDDSTKSQNGFDKWVKGDYKGKEHFLEAFAVIPLNSNLKLTAGADYRSSKSDQVYIGINSFSPLPFESINKSDSLNQNQFAVYSALNWNANSGFSLEAGGRLNIHSEYGSHFVFNFNPSYLIENKWKIFANISSGFRTPSLYQLFSEFGNEDLKPESSLSGELGVQYFSRHDKFSARLTGFLRNVKDVIFFFYNPSTFASQYINQDKQKDRGFELEASFRPTQKLFFRSNYTFVEGEITTKVNGKDTVYDNLLRRPRGSFSLTASMQVTPRLLVSSTILSFGTRNDSYFDLNSFSTVNVTLDNYTLLDIYAEYGFLKNKLKLFADLRNIADKKYQETAGFNTLGFNFAAGARYNFQ